MYSERFMSLDIYNSSYERFCIHLPAQAEILELACGPGNVTQHLFRLRPDIKIKATDGAPEMLRALKGKFPDLETEELDLNNLKSYSGSFDGIVCGFGMPYISLDQVIEFFANCYRLLRQRGVIYFSALEGDYGNSGEVVNSTGEYRFRMYYYNDLQLRTLLLQNGFGSIESHKVLYAPAGRDPETHLIYIAHKTEPV